MLRAPTLTAALALAALLSGACSGGDAGPEVAAWTDPSPHTSGSVTANGVRLHYLDWGGTGPALILIHGFGDNPHAFDDLAPAFTDRFRVLAYARRGHGRSEARPPYDMATLTEDLRQFMDSLGIERAHLVGWSMGGNELTWMAGTHPDRVGRIVYFDAGYDWGDPAVLRAFEAMPIDFTPPAEALTSMDAFRDHHTGVWFPALPDKSRLEGYVRGLVDIQPDGSVRMLMSDSTFNIIAGQLFTERRDYSRVRAPALSIYSETFFDVTAADSAQREMNLAWEREHFSPFRRASIERIRSELPGVEILTVPGTHADFIFTSRDEIVAAMRRFLAD